MKITPAQSMAILKDAEEVGLADDELLISWRGALITLAVAAIGLLVVTYSDEIVRWLHG